MPPTRRIEQKRLERRKASKPYTNPHRGDGNLFNQKYSSDGDERRTGSANSNYELRNLFEQYKNIPDITIDSHKWNQWLHVSEIIENLGQTISGLENQSKEALMEANQIDSTDFYDRKPFYEQVSYAYGFKTRVEEHLQKLLQNKEYINKEPNKLSPIDSLVEDIGKLQLETDNTHDGGWQQSNDINAQLQAKVTSHMETINGSITITEEALQKATDYYNQLERCQTTCDPLRQRLAERQTKPFSTPLKQQRIL